MSEFEGLLVGLFDRQEMSAFPGVGVEAEIAF